jgi:hypothetical protein
MQKKHEEVTCLGNEQQNLQRSDSFLSLDCTTVHAFQSRHDKDKCKNMNAWQVVIVGRSLSVVEHLNAASPLH